VCSKVPPCNCGGQIKFWLYMHPKVCPKIYVVLAARSFLRIVWLSLFLLGNSWGKTTLNSYCVNYLALDLRPRVSLIVQVIYTCLSLARSNIHYFYTIVKI
jgi:hypothetical protein